MNNENQADTHLYPSSNPDPNSVQLGSWCRTTASRPASLHDSEGWEVGPPSSRGKKWSHKCFCMMKLVHTLLHVTGWMTAPQIDSWPNLQNLWMSAYLVKRILQTWLSLGFWEGDYLGWWVGHPVVLLWGMGKSQCDRRQCDDGTRLTWYILKMEDHSLWDADNQMLNGKELDSH